MAVTTTRIFEQVHGLLVENSKIRTAFLLVSIHELQSFRRGRRLSGIVHD